MAVSGTSQQHGKGISETNAQATSFALDKGSMGCHWWFRGPHFQQSDDEQNSDQPFEGFSQDDLDIGEKVLENAVPVNEVILSESDFMDSDSDKRGTLWQSGTLDLSSWFWNFSV